VTNDCRCGTPLHYHTLNDLQRQIQIEKQNLNLERNISSTNDLEIRVEKAWTTILLPNKLDKIENLSTTNLKKQLILGDG